MIRSLQRRALPLLALALMCGAVSAQQYKFFPGGPGLGAGFDPANPVKGFTPCFVRRGEAGDAKSLLPGQFDASTQFLNRLESLYEETSVDIGLSANALGANVDLHRKESQSTDTQSNVTYWYTRISQVYDSQTMTDFDESGALKQRRASGNVSPHDLIDMCGPTYVVSGELAAQLVIVFSSKGVSKLHKESLEQSINGGVSVDGVGSVKFSSTFRRAMESLSKDSAVNYKITGYGIEGIKGLGDGVVASVTIDDFLKGVSNLLLHEVKGFPISFKVAESAQYFGGKPYVFAHSSRELRSLYLRYVDDANRYDKLLDIVDSRDQEYAFLKQEEVDALVAERMGPFKAAMSKSRAAVVACLRGRSCSIDVSPRSIVRWPAPPAGSTCTTWSRGDCMECLFPVALAPFRRGSFTDIYVCDGLPNSTADAAFKGYVVVKDDAHDDNKVWNANIVMRLVAPEGSDRLTCEPRNQALDRYKVDPDWCQRTHPINKTFTWVPMDMKGRMKVVSGRAAVQLQALDCQTGPFSDTYCETSPPGEGAKSKLPQDRGFEPNVFPPPAAYLTVTSSLMRSQPSATTPLPHPRPPNCAEGRRRSKNDTESGYSADNIRYQDHAQ